MRRVMSFLGLLALSAGWPATGPLAQGLGLADTGGGPAALLPVDPMAGPADWNAPPPVDPLWRDQLRYDDSVRFQWLLDNGIFDVEDEELPAAIQEELKRKRCYDMAVDGLWGPGSRAAVEWFNMLSGDSFAPATPSTELYRRLMGAPQVTCDPGPVFSGGGGGQPGRDVPALAAQPRYPAPDRPEIALSNGFAMGIIGERIFSRLHDVPRAAPGTAPIIEPAPPTLSGDAAPPGTDVPSDAMVVSAPLAPMASRAFAAPSDFPPEDFQGYGLIVFTERPSVSEQAMQRFKMFCRAYVAGFPTVDELEVAGIGIEEQMVTVMPLSTREFVATAEMIALFDAEAACDVAANNYGLATALLALRHARMAADLTDDFTGLDGRGPYLLAWNPGVKKGARDALVLVADLTNTRSEEQARTDFRHWRQDVEMRPELWRDGWDIELARRTAQRWLDLNLSLALSLIIPGGQDQEE